MHKWFKDGSLFSAAYTLGISILRAVLCGVFELKFPIFRLLTCLSFLFRKQKHKRQHTSVPTKDLLWKLCPQHSITQVTSRFSWPAWASLRLCPKSPIRTLDNGYKNWSWLICKASFLILWFLLEILVDPFYLRYMFLPSQLTHSSDLLWLAINWHFQKHPSPPTHQVVQDSRVPITQAKPVNLFKGVKFWAGTE